MKKLTAELADKLYAVIDSDPVLTHGAKLKALSLVIAKLGAEVDSQTGRSADVIKKLYRRVQQHAHHN